MNINLYFIDFIKIIILNILLGGDIIKSEIIKIIGITALLYSVIPNNMTGLAYSTENLTYIENVNSLISVETPKLINTKADNETDSNIVVTDIAEILGMDTSDEFQYSLIFGEELGNYDIKYTYSETDTLNTKFDLLEDEVELKEISVLSNTNVRLGPGKEFGVTKSAQKGDILKTDGTVKNGFIRIVNDDGSKLWVVERNINYNINSDEAIESDITPATISFVDQSEALLTIQNPDDNYTGAIVTLDPDDRDLLERLVMGEAGNQGMEGAALVAQAIRDSIVYKGFSSVAEVRSACKYSGSISLEPNDDVKQACAYIFDQGGFAVKHDIYYFYNPAKCKSSWHESQQFIIEIGNHRFFSTW